MCFRKVCDSAFAVSLFIFGVSVVRADTVSGGTASFTETLPFSATLTGFSQYDGVCR
jgi:hypothetical protein